MSDVEAVPEVHPASTSTLAASGNALLSDEGSAPTPDQAAADAAVKQTLHRYLQKHRAALLAKLDGLAERQARWPVTPTGTNVLGLVKHVAGVQAGYFGEVFGAPAAGPARVARVGGRRRHVRPAGRDDGGRRGLPPPECRPRRRDHRGARPHRDGHRVVVA
ncbi:DUF664 domain-containing protein [Curtobacterium flaccumfaciens]|nr:DUF664 domain-containing protein [Curtobacterium flaccumfaciens]